MIRGFTVGTTKDFTLNSGLRLQLSGRLAEDLEVVAAITDENTPIQPEGNTERLEELDKVFIQVKHPNAIGTFGDYQLQRKQGEFGVIDRKLQGLLGEFRYEDYDAYVSVAGSKGKFHSLFFYGSDGVQGPYRLTGINNERDIIVIAGTEKVFIDGIEMRRGEANDYVIEYSNAQIFFTPQRLITSASRINVDFEYTDRRFSRNFFAGGTGAKFFDNKLGLRVQYLREGDDQDAPIDISLTESDKEILQNAGDDRNSAVKSGVSLAPPDSSGNPKGIYRELDTLINGQNYKVYIYDPGNPASIYNVSFSVVSAGKGDYVRESFGVFRFIGIGQGIYMPFIFLPMPEQKQVGNVVLDLAPYEDISLSLEMAGSLWDKNRLSSLSESDNGGYARNVFLAVKPVHIEFGNINFGRAGITYKDRFLDQRFTTADRINEVEFNRNYNIITSAEQQSEQLREIGLNLLPIEQIKLSSTYGYLKRGDDFKSKRSNSLFQFTDNSTYLFNYNFDYVEAKNLSLKSKWGRHKGGAFYKLWIFKPGIDFLAENKLDRRNNQDSLVAGSLKYNEYIPQIALLDIEGLKFDVKYSFRDDHFPINGVMIKESDSRTQFYELEYSGIKEVSTTLNLTFRNKKYTEELKKLGYLNNETVLMRSQTRLSLWEPLDWDLYYEVSTQRSAKLEKVFVRVEQGTGNYKYLGDLNNNGIADEFEFEYTLYEGDYIQVLLPTETLYPVIDLKASTRWKLTLDKLIKPTGFASFLRPISTETYLRVEENSREENYKNIYLLRFSSFLNPLTTIRGYNLIQQDIFAFENSQEFSVRLRYSQKKSLNQYSGGIENGYLRERSLRLRFKMIEEVSNQTDIVFTDDNIDASEISNRRRKITGSNAATEFSYRPERNIEVVFRLKVGRSEDTYPANPTVIDLNSELIRFNLAFAGTGRLRVEAERVELNTNTLENFLPFELTAGNNIGKNYFGRLNFDYRIMANLQSTISYDGRWPGLGRVIHTARAEVRAFF